MSPVRGDIWMINPDFVQANEQSHVRPALVVSDDRLNASAVRLSLVIPVTSRIRSVASHVAVRAPEGGLTSDSALMCEQLRALSHTRFHRCLGQVSPDTMRAVEQVMKRLLGLG